MDNKIAKIDKLKAELAALLPLNKESETKLWQKFRLEWNYNSNHIEGNTLSYGDTKLLFRLGDEFRAQNNSLKDVQEMRAHDVAIEMVKQWANDKGRLISESEIRALNETILVKSFWADAVTPNGQKTRREIIPGEYKKHPNHVQLKSGELFKYAEPNEVSQKMQELMDWYSSENEKEHPLVMAAFLHYKFVCIHPFDDGNGRVSRLLMNYHLLRNGYPPVIIKSKDKDNYLYALQQADAGNTDAFVKYVSEQLIWSLELQLKAAKDESIEEDDDLYKEIEVWKKKALVGKRLKKSGEIIFDLNEKFWKPFIDKFKAELSVFDDLFETKTIEQKDYKMVIKKGIKHKTQINMGVPSTVYPNMPPHLKPNKYTRFKNIDLIEGYYKLSKPKIIGLGNPFSICCTLKFDENKYKISSDKNEHIIEKHYNETPTDNEIDFFLKELAKSIYQKMKAK